MTSLLEPVEPARVHRAIESLHSLSYFSPDMEQQLVACGLRPGRMCYFASRSAPMGAVSPGVTAATFYNFNPDLVARHIPRAWTLASPDAVVAARWIGADLSLRRLLGEAVSSPEVTEAAELARAATVGLDPAGRALFAGHALLDWPDEPHLVLWHAITLLREFRGDGHLAALLSAGLSGIAAIVTHTATGRGFTADSAKLLRGWSDEQWQACIDELTGRGLMTTTAAGPELTAAGKQLRATVEADTDRMAEAPWVTLGPERTARLAELGKALSRIAVGNGAFPAGVFAAAR
jgi:hypothetical protein